MEGRMLSEKDEKIARTQAEESCSIRLPIPFVS